jgi:hypothetical protein
MSVHRLGVAVFHFNPSSSTDHGSPHPQTRSPKSNSAGNALGHHICMTRLTKVLLASAFALTPLLASDMAAEKEAVRRAALDYLDALYKVKPELIERSVHPKLNKLGFYRKDTTVPYREMGMTYDQLLALAGKWNKDGKNVGPKSPYEAIVLDVSDQTAAAKVKAEWGFDYLLLAKYEGKWKIIQILWQSDPDAK